MNPKPFRAAVLAGLALALAVPPALAGASDYVFEPVSREVRNGDGSELAVRLIHKPTGKPVAGAIVFRTRLDMSPGDMAAMTAKHEALAGGEPGIYRFRAKLTMAGKWALKLMAKMQGEPETIEGSVVFEAKD
jgi:YtkA-like